MTKSLLTLLSVFSLTACDGPEPMEICSFMLKPSIEESICICKVRDMETGESLSEAVIHPMSYCDRGIVFRPEGSWPSLDAYLRAKAKEARSWIRRNSSDNDEWDVDFIDQYH